MSLFNSPGVNYTESDATAYTQQLANAIGALVGAFNWGPVEVPTLITNGEQGLAQQFGTPTNDNFLSFFVAADFFSYSNTAWIYREVGTTAKNAVSGANAPILIKNPDAAQNLALTGYDFYGKFPGTPGNAILVSIADSARFPNWEFASSFQYKPLAGEFSIAIVDTKGIWVGTGGNPQTESLTVSGTATAAGTVVFAGATATINAGDTANAVASEIAAAMTTAGTFASATAFKNVVTYVRKTNGLQTVETAPTNADGLTYTVTLQQSGRLGSLLEKYELVQQSSTAKNADGTSAYFANAMKNSNYVGIGDATVALTAKDIQLAGGVDDNSGVNITNGVQALKNKVQYNLAYLIAGAVTTAEQQAVADLVTTRGDCMGFVSPMLDDVYNNKGHEVADVTEWRSQEVNKETSYLHNDDNWGYIYDKYNDTYRWIPCCGGTAGIYARSANENDPWVPAAGHTRGIYKNYIKLAWNSDEGDRDQLYRLGVNSIVSFPGEGIILYGDKTSQSRPSAFDHANVRWAFIVARTSLSAMAKYFLWELNTPFTRNQFVNAARPFLRNMVARNAFEDFKIICDATNNNGQTLVSNQLVAQILLKPTYSINWVSLNLTAVRPDVTFEEVQVQG